MCYYNAQQLKEIKNIKLKEIDKQVADNGLFQAALQDGFAYGSIATLKPIHSTSAGSAVSILPDQAAMVDVEIAAMEWGLIPDEWYGRPIDNRQKADDFRKGYLDASGKFVPGITMLNAMSEEMLLPYKKYREPALHHRCLVLSTGFYEWRHVYPLHKKTGKPLKTAAKIPHFISVRDQDYFFMAGVYKSWTDRQTGEMVDTVSIVTTAAPDGHLMATIHNSKFRMPSILNEDLAFEWIFGKLTEERLQTIAQTVFPSDQLQAITIAKDFKTALDPQQAYRYAELTELYS